MTCIWRRMAIIARKVIRSVGDTKRTDQDTVITSIPRFTLRSSLRNGVF